MTVAMTRAAVQDWLDRYIAAWASFDEGAIGDLFSADASYRFHPADEPFIGREAIVRSWVAPEGVAGTRDAPGTWEAHYEPFTVDGDRAVTVGWSRFWTDASRTTESATYDNCFLLEFDADGRCRSYVEFFGTRSGEA